MFNQNQRITNMINELKSNGSSNEVFNQMYNTNPSFRKFADSVRDLTPEQAFSRYGLDFNKFRGFKW